MKYSILLLLVSAAAHAQTGTITKIVSTASGAPLLAPNSLTTIYGTNLTTRTESAPGVPLPGNLAGIAVVVSGANFSTGAALIYASPTQINLVMPIGTPSGTVTVKVNAADEVIASGTAEVQLVAPALFSANGTGSGVAAAIGIRVVIPTQIQSIVPVFTCDSAPTNCRALPLDVGLDAPVFLELFATGIRGGSSVTATIGGQSVPVQYAGIQPQFPGLDQVNLPLILNLRGAGLVDVVVTVDGKASNPVQVLIQ
jgi:uncharacterized protein (TIGR03437 family)